MNLNQIIAPNHRDNFYISAAKEIIDLELSRYWNCYSEYDKQYILSVIYKNLQILKGEK